MRADDALRHFRLDGAVAAITGGARGEIREVKSVVKSGTDHGFAPVVAPV